MPGSTSTVGPGIIFLGKEGEENERQRVDG